MGSTLWTPEDDLAPELDSTETARHHCMGCGAAFHSERLFLRHEARCDTAHAAYEAEIALRRTEPLAQTDEERLRFLREKAERERDWSVKGTSVFDSKRTEAMERSGTLRKINRKPSGRR